MKKRELLYGFCACFLIYALLRHPDAMLSISAKSIQVWLAKVFPALFPFIAACSILLQIGTAERISRFLQPVTKVLFGLDGIVAFPFFCGILSGYPMGAKITAQLYEKKRISLQEARHILVFSNNPGPLFLIGTIGAGFFGMPALGYLLFVSCLFGAVLTGFLYRFPYRYSIVVRSASRSSKTIPPLTEILSSAISDALHTVLLIGGYLILFSTLSEAIRLTGIFGLFSGISSQLPLSAETLQGLCSGILEMTNGAYLLSKSPDGLQLRLTLTAFLVSFGGLSILGQTFGILSAVPIDKKHYCKGKIANALFSSVFCYFLYPFFVQKAQKAVPVFSVFTETAFTLSFLWLLPSLFFLGVLFHALICKR